MFSLKYSGRFDNVSLATTVLSDIFVREDMKGKFKG